MNAAPLQFNGHSVDAAMQSMSFRPVDAIRSPLAFVSSWDQVVHLVSSLHCSSRRMVLTVAKTVHLLILGSSITMTFAQCGGFYLPRCLRYRMERLTGDCSLRYQR